MRQLFGSLAASAGHEPFRFERENAKGGRNSHPRRRVGGAVRGAGDLPDKLQNRRGQAVAGGQGPQVIGGLAPNGAVRPFNVYADPAENVARFHGVEIAARLFWRRAVERQHLSGEIKTTRDQYARRRRPFPRGKK
jgi:hypothetical protein